MPQILLALLILGVIILLGPAIAVLVLLFTTFALLAAHFDPPVSDLLLFVGGLAALVGAYSALKHSIVSIFGWPARSPDAGEYAGVRALAAQREAEARALAAHHEARAAYARELYARVKAQVAADDRKFGEENARLRRRVVELEGRVEALLEEGERRRRARRA